MRRFTALLSLSLLLVACQSAPQTSAPAGLSLSEGLGLSSVAESPLDFVSKSHAQAGSYQSPRLAPLKFEPSAKLLVKGNTVTLELRLPPLPEQGFRTQMLDLSTAAKISATVSDSYGKTYQPVGAVAGLVDYPVSGVINLTFNNVIPDQLLFVELQTRDAGADIPQAELATVVSHTAISDINTTVNFLTTPSAKAMKALLSGNASRARAIDLGALAALIENITGYVAGSPPTYTTHPSLVNTALLAADLVATDPGSLIPSNYRRLGATISLDISGLVGTDTLNVQVTDAASALASALANGNAQLISAATPGTGLKVLAGGAAGNSTQYTFSALPAVLTLTDNTTTPVTLTATPAIPVIGSLSPNTGVIGSTLTITGSNFSTVLANNQVRFGSETATVNSATATSLNVTVPPNIWGIVPVTVSVGASTSAGSNYRVKPLLTSAAPTSGSTGDVITLTGTGFDPTPANNTINFFGSNLTPTTASTTSLSFAIFERPAGSSAFIITTGGVASDINGSVAVGINPKITALTTAEEVGGKAVLIRGQALTITGSNFHPTASNNLVHFTLPNSTIVGVQPATATATSLTVMVPDTVNLAGDIGVRVSVSLSNSNTVTAMVPGVALNVSNGGFY